MIGKRLFNGCQKRGEGCKTVLKKRVRRLPNMGEGCKTGVAAKLGLRRLQNIGEMNAFFGTVLSYFSSCSRCSPGNTYRLACNLKQFAIFSLLSGVWEGWGALESEGVQAFSFQLKQKLQNCHGFSDCSSTLVCAYITVHNRPLPV
jgi:hypothetical protein